MFWGTFLSLFQPGEKLRVMDLPDHRGRVNNTINPVSSLTSIFLGSDLFLGNGRFLFFILFNPPYGVITDLEPDILDREVKWDLESITTNKASGGDGIPVELFRLLKDDAVKVLHSICQQIWKTEQ